MAAARPTLVLGHSPSCARRAAPTAYRRPDADGAPLSAETVRAHERRAIEALDDDIPF